MLPEPGDRGSLPRRAPLAAVRSGRGGRAGAGGLGLLQPLLEDRTVSEVMVNGPGRAVWVERCGRLEPTDVELDGEALDLLVERLTGPLGHRVDRTRPMLDARLPDGSRVNVVVPPLAVDGPCVTIRRFVVRAIALDELCPPPVAGLLAAAVADRRNIVVTGGTGAGKTTLVNALGARIGTDERVVTVEDAAELDLGHPHVVRLEARGTASGVGPPPSTIRDLLRNALRMRPDRIVVGEVRGSEALDLVVSMNTGHEGTLATVHANRAAEALRRLEAMVLLAGTALPLDAVRAQLGAALDLVVHVARATGGRRAVVEVVEPDPLGREVRTVADAGGVVGALARPPRARPW